MDLVVRLRLGNRPPAQGFVLLVAAGALFLGKRLVKLIRYVREPILIAFSTASSVSHGGPPATTAVP